MIDAPGPPQIVALAAETPQSVGTCFAIGVRVHTFAILKYFDLVQVIEIRRRLILAPHTIVPSNWNLHGLRRHRAIAARGRAQTCTMRHPHAAISVAGEAII